MPFKIRIHRSFFQLFIVLALVVALQGRGADAVIQFTAAFALLFVAVILHESSHAFVARSLGVHVRDIVVHPLGGMTRLDWTARNPRKEALISCAGPAVNLVMAGVALGRLPWDARRAWALDVLGRRSRSSRRTWRSASSTSSRRSRWTAGASCGPLLSSKLGHLPATRIAARIGRWVAALTLLAPFVGPSFGWTFLQSLALPIVGLFVFVLGEIELKQAEAAELLSRMGAAARDARRARSPARRDRRRGDVTGRRGSVGGATQARRPLACLSCRSLRSRRERLSVRCVGAAIPAALVMVFSHGELVPRWCAGRWPAPASSGTVGATLDRRPPGLHRRAVVRDAGESSCDTAAGHGRRASTPGNRLVGAARSLTAALAPAGREVTCRLRVASRRGGR